MNSALVEEARKYMQECTIKNLAPAWELTEIAIHYWKILAKAYGIDENKVLVALYLAHCVFSNVRNSNTMKSHTILSSQMARVRLQERNVENSDIEDICMSIQLHHNTENSGNIFYEVVKNAESFKFITRKWMLVFIHHLGERWLSYSEAEEYAIQKLKQKESYLTLDKAKELAGEFLDTYKIIITF